MRFSFVIPVALYRDAEVLESLKNLDYPKKEYEVIIERGENPSRNRNKGAEKAKGEIIIFLDDDAKIEKNFLKKAEKFFEDYGVDVVGGPQLTPKDDKRFAKISGYVLTSIFGGFSIRNRYKRGRIDLDADERKISSANLLCKREVLQKIKFNPKLWPGEDPDFINRCKENGFIVAYSPDIFVYHRRRANLSGFVRQIFSYGKTRPAIRTERKRKINFFFLVPSFFLIYILMLILMNFFVVSKSLTGSIVGIHQSVLVLFYSPFILYVLLNLLFSLFISLKEKDLLGLLVLPFLFFMLHISYGLGLIIGLIKKKK